MNSTRESPRSPSLAGSGHRVVGYVVAVRGAAFADELLSDEVYQATGIISVQADCDVNEALRRLKSTAAFLGDDTLDDAARYVIAHLIRYD